MRTVLFGGGAEEMMERRVADWRAQNPGKRAIRLDASVPGQPMHGAPLAAMQAAVAQLGCKGTFPGNTPAGGSAELREAAVNGQTRNGVSLDAEEVFAFAGVSAALTALMGLAAPQARVLVSSLCEPSVLRAIHFAGHEAVFVPAGEDSEFLPLPESLSAVETPDLILLAHPSPVSGTAYSMEQLAQWVRYAAGVGAFLVIDTTYASYMPEGERCGILQSSAARACTAELHSLSATEGFCAVPCALLYAARELAPGGTSLHHSLSARAACADGLAHPVNRAATALLEAIQGEPTAGWRRNAALFFDALTEQGARFLGGTESPFFWVRCPTGYEADSHRFFEALLEECGTVCVPGAVFGAAGEGWFRLSALCDQAAAEIAMKRMKQSFLF